MSSAPRTPQPASDPLADTLPGFPFSQHLQELSTRLIEEGNVEAVYEQALETAMLLVDADMASLRMLDEEAGEFRLLAAKGYVAPAIPPLVLRRDSNTPCAHAARTGSRVIIADLEAVDQCDEGIGELLRAAGVCCSQATPLISRSGRTLGIISTHWREAKLPPDRAWRLFDVLARQTADLLERTQSEARLRRTHQQKDALYELSDRLQRTRSLDDVYDAALSAIVASLQCDRASILLFDQEGHMRFVAWGGLSSNYRRMVEGHSAWRQGDANPAPIHVDDVKAADMDEALRSSILAEGIAALAFIPLVSEGVLIGKFMAYFDRPHAFSQDEMSLCLTIARQVAFAIERKRGEHQLRASEKRFRDMIDALPAALYMTDADGYVLHFNRAAVAFAGRTPVPGVDRWCICSKVFFPDGTPMDMNDVPMARALRGESVEVGAELIAERPDGTRRWLVPHPTMLRDAAGRISGGVNMLVDITERKQAEQALREADRRKDEFLAMLSHELRNPLAPISIAVQVLNRSVIEDPVQKEARAIIDRQTANLTRLVDDLLEVSRITTGRIQLQMRRAALSDIVERALESVRSTISACRHTLHVSMPKDALWLHADAARIEQVLVNLLNNAAKYTDAGGRIQLLVELEGTQAVVRVVDNGIGIEPELLPQVFGLFIQAKRSLERSQGGLGIGLSLVERLVTMHGGSVAARSTLGQGSEFTVRLPVHQVGNMQPNEQGDSASRRLASGLRVLVVDDNLDAARSLALLLESSGYSVGVADDGQSAIEAVHETRPNVVFLDLGLPGIDGFEVAQRLRNHYPREQLTLVALTGYGQSADRERTAQAGFDRHLLKPADISAVMSCLAEASTTHAIPGRH